MLKAAYCAKTFACEQKLYALKKLVFCQIKIGDYDAALKTLKQKLQLAWVSDNYLAEIDVYH